MLGDGQHIFVAELNGGQARPVGFAQELSCQKHKIGAPLPDDFVGLSSGGDEADCGSGNASFLPNPFGKANLITRPDGNMGIRHISAAAAINQIQSLRFQPPRELDTFLNIPTIVNPVSGGNAGGKRKIFRPDGADGARGLHSKPDAVIKTAAVLVRAMMEIGERNS